MISASATLLRTQTDERLVALARAGHERAFEAIVERYRRPLLRHCRRYLSEGRAEDALQQALVSAWTALRRGDDVRELRPWLYRIVHNSALNAIRASGYDYEQLRDTLQGGPIGPQDLAERSAVVRETLAGLAALPERQREALLRIAIDGRSQDEVAAELGVSQGAVRQLVHRARTSLRAAATALMPLPLIAWLAAGSARGDEGLAARVAELVAGATGIGGGTALAKAGTVAVLTGTAMTGPMVIDGFRDDQPVPRADAATTARGGSGDDETLDQGPGDRPRTPIASPPGGRGAGGPDDHGEHRGRDRDDDRGHDRDEDDHDERRGRDRGEDDDDSHGHGGDDERDDDRSSPTRRSGSSGSSGADEPSGSDRSDDDSSGSRGSDDDAPGSDDSSSGSGSAGESRSADADSSGSGSDDDGGGSSSSGDPDDD